LQVVFVNYSFFGPGLGGIYVIRILVRQLGILVLVMGRCPFRVLLGFVLLRRRNIVFFNRAEGPIFVVRGFCSRYGFFWLGGLGLCVAYMKVVWAGDH
jgi:hypothetical protein